MMAEPNPRAVRQPSPFYLSVVEATGWHRADAVSGGARISSLNTFSDLVGSVQCEGQEKMEHRSRGVAQHALDRSFKRRQFVLHNVPDNLAIDSKVFVDQDIP
jgi:hypothetical protein